MTTTRSEFRGQGRPEEFADVLVAFKERGCTLLVTGEIGAAVSARATRKLMGSTVVDRSRVLVVAGSTEEPLDRFLPGGLGPGADAVRVVRHASGGRAESQVATDAESRPPAADLDALADGVEAAVDDLAPDDAGFGPAELRLSVTSLPALLDRYDTDAVAGFVDALGDVVMANRGMAHCHLPVADDAAVVTGLSGAVDARIELRQEAGTIAEQRWHVPAFGTTEWVTL